MANQIMGYEGRIEYVEESSYGVSPLSSTLCWIGDVRKFSMNVKTEKKTRWRMRPRSATNQRTPAGIASGKTTLNAKIEWAPQAANTSADLNYMSFVAMCIGTSTGIADTRKSITLNVVNKDGTCEGPILGAVCKTFSVKCAVGEDVIMNAEFEGATYDPSAPLNVTSDLSGATDSFEQAAESAGEVLDFSDCTLTISGTAQGNITDFEFKIDNRAVGRPRFGTGGLPGEVVQKPAEITGKLVFDLEDNVELLRLLAQASFTLTIVIGAYTWTFTGCEWSDESRDQDVENPVQIPMSFTAVTAAVA